MQESPAGCLAVIGGITVLFVGYVLFYHFLSSDIGFTIVLIAIASYVLYVIQVVFTQKKPNGTGKNTNQINKLPETQNPNSPSCTPVGSRGESHPAITQGHRPNKRTSDQLRAESFPTRFKNLSKSKSEFTKPLTCPSCGKVTSPHKTEHSNIFACTFCSQKIVR